MSVRTTTTARSRARRGAVLVAATAAVAAALTGCTASADQDSAAGGSGPSGSDGATGATQEPAAPPVRVTANVRPGRLVTVDTVLRVAAHQGTLDRVRVTSADGKQTVRGALAAKDSRWTATAGALEPGTSYRVRTVAHNADGAKQVRSTAFRTQPLALDQQTYPSIAPLQGETVGVGMPVIVTFDVPVTNRAAIEKHLSVDSKPAQPGAWHWMSDSEVHWRPKTYWRAGSDVTVHADINSVPAGNGIYGQLSRSTSFHVGAALVMKVDVARHEMRVNENGRLLRTIPISAGKPGFTTRSGIKVIIEKFRTKRMDAATTGISKDDPEYYNIANVEYAQRVTYSGEFLHAAPWSVGSQGSANVSHGCVGMSTADAAWLYGLTKRGDVVDVSGSDRYMTLDNGYGDWNLPFSQYRAGSALS